MSAAGWVFVNLDTGTSDGLGESAYAIDLDVLDDGQRTVLESCEDFGSFDPAAVALVEAVSMPLDAAVEVVDVLRRVVFPVASSRSAGWVGTGTLRAAVSMIGADLDGPSLEVRDAAVAELRRALLILDTLASSTLDAEAMLEALELHPSGLHSALEAVVLNDRHALEERVRAEILDGGTLEDWARSEGYRRRNGGWVNECDDDVDLEDELDDEVRRVADGLEALGGGI